MSGQWATGPPQSMAVNTTPSPMHTHNQQQQQQQPPMQQRNMQQQQQQQQQQHHHMRQAQLASIAHLPYMHPSHLAPAPFMLAPYPHPMMMSPFPPAVQRPSRVRASALMQLAQQQHQIMQQQQQQLIQQQHAYAAAPFTPFQMSQSYTQAGMDQQEQEQWRLMQETRKLEEQIQHMQVQQQRVRHTPAANAVPASDALSSVPLVLTDPSRLQVGSLPPVVLCSLLQQWIKHSFQYSSQFCVSVRQVHEAWKRHLYAQSLETMQGFVEAMKEINPIELRLWTGGRPLTEESTLHLVARSDLMRMQSFSRNAPFNAAPTAPTTSFTLSLFLSTLRSLPPHLQPQLHPTVQRVMQQMQAQKMREWGQQQENMQQHMIHQQQQQQHQTEYSQQMASPDQFAPPSTVAAAAAADVLPPDDLCFSPHAHPFYRDEWDKLLVAELDSEHATECKADREGISIQCIDPLKREVSPCQDADFGYLPIQLKAVAHLHDLLPSQQQQREDGNNGAEQWEEEEEGYTYEEEKREQEEQTNEQEEKQQQQLSDEAKEQQQRDEAEDAEEADIAARYQHPLIDPASYASSSSSPGTVSASDLFNDDGDGGGRFSSLVLSAPLSSDGSACADTTAFWQFPHPLRRLFRVKNSQAFPIVMQCRFVRLHDHDHESDSVQSNSERQFDLYTSSGQSLSAASRLVLEPDSSVEVVVEARRPATQVGLAQQFVVFHFELPALWPRVVRAKQGQTQSFAQALLSYEVKHCAIVRGVRALNTDPLAAKLLSRESKPFFPAWLRSSFEETPAVVLRAEPPPLPPSFLRALAYVDSFDLPPSLVALNAARANPLQPQASAAFEQEWTRHVAAIRQGWIEQQDAYGFGSVDVQRMEEEGEGGEGEEGQLQQDSSILDASLELRARIRSHLCNIHIGLHAEELQMQLDVRSYDLFFISLRPQHQRSAAAEAVLDPSSDLASAPPKLEIVGLRVPGVAERRPAVAIGESIELRVADHPTPISLHAFVTGVQEDVVLVSFPLTSLRQTLQLDSDAEVFQLHFHVRFSVDRLPYRYMYRALLHIHSSPHAARFLFPQEHHLLPSSPSHSRSLSVPPSLPVLRPFDEHVNFEQLSAVQHVVAGSHGRAPFVLFGPPGTGKTLTVVEAILQLLRAHAPGPAARVGADEGLSSSSARILVVTPSNFAADVVVERLAPHLRHSSAMLRLNSYQRHTAVRPSVQKYLFFDEEEPSFYGLPSGESLRRYAVVVMTCAQAGVLLDLGLPRGSFTHIVFDESCQALEAEALIPLCMAGARTGVILAGDHMQLGAEVHSAVASSLGLKVSLQERLLRHAIYQQSLAQSPHSGACCAIQLTKNYRSHQSLLAISSALFYNGSLQAYAPSSLVSSLERWECLPNRRGFPLLFYGLIGQDVYEEEYSSFYNPLEAAKLVQIMEELLASKTVPGLSTNDIGVIAPYRKQVIILRQLLRSRGLGSVRVGSVDDYQGSEEKVIFVSTVVSRPRAMFDAHHGAPSSPTATGAPSSPSSPSALRPSPSSLPLGILRNSARFNVALSRAKALTVVVGNPNLLAKEEYWRDLLVYAIENGAYVGCSCALQKEVQKKQTLGGGAMSQSDHEADPSFAPLPVRVASFLSADADADIDPDDITGWEEGNHFFDGAWRVML